MPSAAMPSACWTARVVVWVLDCEVVADGDAAAPPTSTVRLATRTAAPARPRRRRRRRRNAASRRSSAARWDTRISSRYQGSGSLFSFVGTAAAPVVAVPTGLAVGLALDLRYAALWRRFAPWIERRSQWVPRSAIGGRSRARLGYGYGELGEVIGYAPT